MASPKQDQPEGAALPPWCSEMGGRVVRHARSLQFEPPGCQSGAGGSAEQAAGDQAAVAVAAAWQRQSHAGKGGWCRRVISKDRLHLFSQRRLQLRPTLRHGLVVGMGGVCRRGAVLR